MTSWNAIFGHTWTGTKIPNAAFGHDELYDGVLKFIEHGLSGISDMEPQQRRIIIKRYNFGYRQALSDPLQLVFVHKGPLPWLVAKTLNIPIVLATENEHTFRVVRPSKRDIVIHGFFKDVKEMKLNPHTLFDTIFRHFWLGISRRYISEFLIQHASMQFFRESKAEGVKPVVKSFRPTKPFEHWQMDFTTMGTGQITNNEIKKKNKGYDKLFVLIDIFSKFVYIYPTRDEKIVTVVNILNRLFLSGDSPSILHSDNGKSFISADVAELCKQFNVNQRFGAAYTPQTQGFVENKNHYIKKMIYNHFTRNKTLQFYDLVDRIAFSINNTKHSVTGFTPMQIHRGREVPVEITSQMSTKNALLDAVNFTENLHVSDVVNHVNASASIEKVRVSHVREILKNVANNRERVQALKQTKPYMGKLNVGTTVTIATYLLHSDQAHSDHIQPIIIFLTSKSDRLIVQNPLTLGGQVDHVKKQRKHIKSTKKLVKSMFLKVEYKHLKWYNEIILRNGKKMGSGKFKIKLTKISAHTKSYSLQYTYQDPDNNERTNYNVTWLRQPTDTVESVQSEEETEWFHGNMLLEWKEFTGTEFTDADAVETRPKYPFIV